MACHSRMKCIAYSLATLFILLTPVTAGGYAFDSATCSLQAIAFLTVEVKRAVTTCSNVFTVLNRQPMTIQDDLMGAIYLATGDEEPIASLLAVFGGGEIENQIGQTRQIAGIKSYDTLLPNYDSTRFGIEADDDDVEGNLFISCNADELGEGLWNEAGNYYHTHDRATGIYFGQPYRHCAPGEAAFFVHPVRGLADRVRICDWVLEEFVAHFSAGQSWDTTLSINHMRTLAPADPADPGSIEGRQQVEGFIEARNAALLPILPDLVIDYDMGHLSDIDLSMGFDTWLIYILTQTRAGGLRQDINTVDQLYLLPTNGWSVATSIELSDGRGLLRSLSYMLVAQVCFNYHVGFVIDEVSGKYDELHPAFQPPDFGADHVPAGVY